jgi:amino acid transporter
MDGMSTGAPSGTLSRWDAASIIVGIIVGSSIFQAPPDVFACAGDPWTALGVWAAVGVLSLIGALCYAELATAYPTSGGDYTYLTNAFGRPFGFFFAWSELSVIRTGGSIAIMAYVFANYASDFTKGYLELPLSVWAIGSVVLLSIVNALGVQPGKWTQNVLTVAKVVGLLGIIIVGLLLAQRPTEVVEPFKPLPHQTLPLAFVLVFYAYGGWNEAAYVAAEMRRPRDIVVALMLGTGLVMLIYLAVNLAFWLGLGYDTACRSQAIAGVLFRQQFGEVGGKVIDILVMISALGAINGLLFTGVRLYQTFSREHRLFQFLGYVDWRGVALPAIAAQMFFSLLMVALIESVTWWKPWLGRLLGAELLEFGAIKPGFETLFICTAPVFWVFFLLSGLAFLKLRLFGQLPERAFQLPAPWFPILPLIFVASSGFMLYKSTDWALNNKPGEAIVVLLLMALGPVLYVVSQLLGRRSSDQR